MSWTAEGAQVHQVRVIHQAAPYGGRGRGTGRGSSGGSLLMIVTCSVTVSIYGTCDCVHIWYMYVRMLSCLNNNSVLYRKKKSEIRCTNFVAPCNLQCTCEIDNKNMMCKELH